MICDIPSSQDAFIHQILNSHLKEYRRYAPDSMQILETRSEVKFKVIVAQLWYMTLRHSKMHIHTKFEFPTSNNMRYAPDTIILKTRSEVKVNVTYRLLCHEYGSLSCATKWSFFSQRIGSLAILFSNITLLFYGKPILKANQTL